MQIKSNLMCPRCGKELVLGKVLFQPEDVAVDDSLLRVSNPSAPGSWPAEVINCWKCPDCGYSELIASESKGIPVPIEWKRVPDEHDLYMTKVGRGLLIKDLKYKNWHYHVQRGNLTGGADNWGPLKTSFDDPYTAINECLYVDQMLEKSGWFDLRPDMQLSWNWDEMQSCLKSIEMEYIPEYLKIKI